MAPPAAAAALQRARLVAPPAALQALQALYHGDPAVKDQANKWLESFQQSAEAWQVGRGAAEVPNSPRLLRQCLRFHSNS